MESLLELFCCNHSCVDNECMDEVPGEEIILAPPEPFSTRPDDNTGRADRLTNLFKEYLCSERDTFINLLKQKIDLLSADVDDKISLVYLSLQNVLRGHNLLCKENYSRQIDDICREVAEYFSTYVFRSLDAFRVLTHQMMMAAIENNKVEITKLYDKRMDFLEQYMRDLVDNNSCLLLDMEKDPHTCFSAIFRLFPCDIMANKIDSYCVRPTMFFLDGSLGSLQMNVDAYMSRVRIRLSQKIRFPTRSLSHPSVLADLIDHSQDCK